MTPEEEKQIANWNDRLEHQIEPLLVLTPDHRGKTFGSFYRGFSQLAPKMQFAVKEVDSGLPHVQIGESIRYHALAGEGELLLFLEALSNCYNGANPRAKRIEQKRENEIDLPAFLKLFITNQCPYCPTMVRRLFSLTDKVQNLKIDVIDGTLFTETAAEHGIRSVPTLILDNEIRWNGLVDVDELLKVMSSRDPSKLGAQSLESLLKEGEASRLAAMMMKQRKIFPAFLELLIHEKWPTRLGAMVVLEEIIEKDAVLAETLIDLLGDTFALLSDQVKGDMIYVFGQMASPRVLPLIQSALKESDNVEIREAALEALQKIKPAVGGL